MSKRRWLSERITDPWYRKAKKEGYPSRAAYKLIYVHNRYGIIKEGDVVVDLGSAPGGMLSVESNLVGKNGRVIAIDTKEITFNADNVTKLHVDIMTPDAKKIIANALGWKRCDVLISDVSPNLSGIREYDTAVQLELILKVIEISDLVLRIGGNILIKAFECEDLVSIENGLRESFTFYKRVKTPPSTWKHSSEVFLMGIKKVKEGVYHIIQSIQG